MSGETWTLSAGGAPKAKIHRECFAPLATDMVLEICVTIPRAHQACASMENLRNYNVISRYFLEFCCVFFEYFRKSSSDYKFEAELRYLHHFNNSSNFMNS